jgi:hypothetical protein
LQDLLDVVRYLLEQNTYLTERLLQLSGVTSDSPKELEEKIEISQMQSIGKVPWNMMKDKLEAIYKKPKLSEITGISEITGMSSLEEIQHEANIFDLIGELDGGAKVTGPANSVPANAGSNISMLDRIKKQTKSSS